MSATAFTSLPNQTHAVLSCPSCRTFRSSISFSTIRSHSRLPVRHSTRVAVAAAVQHRRRRHKNPSSARRWLMWSPWPSECVCGRRSSRSCWFWCWNRWWREEDEGDGTAATAGAIRAIGKEACMRTGAGRCAYFGGTGEQVVLGKVEKISTVYLSEARKR